MINVVLPAFGIDVRGAFNEQLLVWSLVDRVRRRVHQFGVLQTDGARHAVERQQITSPRSHAEQMIYGSVQDIARRLNITMPEVWVYESEDPNAFATGPSKNNSMVAVSTGLLQNLKEDEVRAVLAHEMGHVYNGDMFTTTVLAGLMNTFVYLHQQLPVLAGRPIGRPRGRRSGKPVSRLHRLYRAASRAVLHGDAGRELAFATARIRRRCVFREGVRQGRHDLGPARPSTAG